MELNKEELKRITRLQKWGKSKKRKVLLYSLIALLGLLFVYFIIMSLVGAISWKELGWIIFLLMAIVVWCKAVYNLESNITFLLKIIEKQRRIHE